MKRIFILFLFTGIVMFGVNFLFAENDAKIVSVDVQNSPAQSDINSGNQSWNIVVVTKGAAGAYLNISVYGQDTPVQQIANDEETTYFNYSGNAGSGVATIWKDKKDNSTYGSGYLLENQLDQQAFTVDNY